MIKKILHIISDKQKKQALLLLVLMLIGMALETLGVGLVVPAVMLMMQDNLASKYPMIEKFFLALGQTDKSSRAIVFMFFLVTIYFIKNAYIAFLVWQQNKYAFSVQASLSARLFKAYIQQPYTFYMTVNTAELHRNIMYEVGLFTGGVNNALLALTEILVMIGVGGLLLMLQPVGAFIIVLILGGAALVFFTLTKKHILRWGVLRQVHDGKKSKFLQEALTGVKEVKLLGRELEFFERFNQHNLMTSKLNARQSTFIQLPRLWIEFLMILALAILIFVMMFRGLDATTIIPTLGLFAAAAFRLMPSLNRILAAIQGLKFILPVIDKLDEELNIQANNLTKEHIPNLNFSNQIQLENITFQYPASSLMALNEIKIKIGKGESVGLIGASGSGKSTLMDIVLGLLSPMTGTVSVDGVNIQSNLRAWQNKIGYVPQSIFLTDDSILQNIAFGIPSDEVRQDLVDKAIMAAQLDTFVKSLPDGIHTIVGERGIKLSGGQRQRIGIARALYHEPEVLVLDEATSALDTATEQEVMQSINQLKSNKTILIIAHRLSTVMQCDRLYKLEGGVIVAEGKPEAIVMTE